VDSVLCIPGSVGRYRIVNRLTDSEFLASFEVSGPTLGSPIFREGEEVRVISGDWEGLTGVFISTFGDQVKIHLQLRSKSRILVLHREQIVKG
jgi:transcription antitermination factor NusG